jgi:hypothetical protein
MPSNPCLPMFVFHKARGQDLYDVSMGRLIGSLSRTCPCWTIWDHSPILLSLEGLASVAGVQSQLLLEHKLFLVRKTLNSKKVRS